MYELIYVILFGLFTGFAISIPVGAMSLYCIKNTMNHSVKLGIISGMGAAFADFLYAIVAAFSVNSIQELLIDYRAPIRIIGGFLIIALGIRVFQTIPIPAKAVQDTENKFKCFIYGFLMTITNPMTFIAFTFIFTTFGLSSHLTHLLSPYGLVISIFIGGICWWTTLSLMIKYVKHKISENFLVHVNKGSAILLFILGTGSIISAFRWLI